MSIMRLPRPSFAPTMVSTRFVSMLGTKYYHCNCCYKSYFGLWCRMRPEVEQAARVWCVCSLLFMEVFFL